MHLKIALISICALAFGRAVVAIPLGEEGSKLEARAPQLVCQVATAGNPNWADAACSARVSMTCRSSCLNNVKLTIVAVRVSWVRPWWILHERYVCG